MRMDCFAWEGTKRNDDGIIWIENERCFCLNTKDCDKCAFYKPNDTLTRHEFYIHDTKIVEWISREETE